MENNQIDLHTIFNEFKKKIELKDINEAEKLFKEYHINKPNHINTILMKSVLLTYKKEYKKAELLLKKYIYTQKNRSLLYKNLAFLYIEQKNYVDAMNIYMNLLNSPCSMEEKKYYEYAIYYIKAKHNNDLLAQEIQRKDDIVKKFKDMYAANYNLAVKYLNGIIGESDKKYICLSYVCKVQKKHKKALKYALNAQTINPNNVPVLINLSTAYLNTQNYYQSRVIAESLWNQKVRNTDLYNLILNIYEYYREYKEKANIFLEYNKIEEYENCMLKAMPKALPKGKLNILFVQKNPCVRNYKYAKVLTANGHKIALAYMYQHIVDSYKELSNIYNSVFKIKDFKELWELSAYYDLVHYHNEPDYISAILTSGSYAPVIHDTHDMMTIREKNNINEIFEPIAQKNAQGNIYVSNEQRRIAHALYDIPIEDTSIIYNYVFKKEIDYKPKLSKLDGKIHIVYEGGFFFNVPHRDFRSVFIELLSMTSNIVIHIYPTMINKGIKEWIDKYENIILHKPVSPMDIINELTQYDYGIAPFPITKDNNRHLQTTLPNKMFEYIYAGLPIIARDLKEMTKFITENKCGIVFSETRDIVYQLDYLKNIKIDNNLRHCITFESQREKIEKFYLQVINNNQDFIKKKLDYFIKKSNNQVITTTMTDESVSI